MASLVLFSASSLAVPFARDGHPRGSCAPHPRNGSYYPSHAGAFGVACHMKLILPSATVMLLPLQLLMYVRRMPSLLQNRPDSQLYTGHPWNMCPLASRLVWDYVCVALLNATTLFLTVVHSQLMPI
jgi:hypothetical protein